MTTLVSGLDLGQVADYSALATLERSPAPEPTRKRRWRYTLRWLETWDLGTRYTATKEGERSICGDIRDRFDTDALANTWLAVDFTGVGTAVVDSLRAAKVPARINPVLITSGHQISRPEENKERSWHVPKKELVSTLVTLLQAGLLTWPRVDPAARTPFARTLARFEKELAEFRVKVTRSANETFSGDKSQHDDLVLAVMLAAWLGEHVGTGDASGIGVPEGKDASSVGAAPDDVFHTGKGV
jgi:hypothetical protein